MKIIEPITLFALWWEKEQSNLNDIGIRPSISDTIRKPVTFYVIDHCYPYTEDGQDLSTVYSSGIEYIIDMPIERLKEFISKHMMA
jgi:hypothetical protein